MKENIEFVKIICHRRPKIWNVGINGKSTKAYWRVMGEHRKPMDMANISGLLPF